jgi:hypothetical protein
LLLSFRTTTSCLSTATPSLIPSSYNLNSCPNNPIYQPSYLSTQTSYSYSSPIFQAITCYGGVLALTCPSGQLISIYSAYYGVQPDTSSYCTLSSNTQAPASCFATSSFTTVKTQCQGLNSCTIGASSYYLFNPCNAAFASQMQLFVQYQCVNSTMLTLLSSCTPNTAMTSACPSSSDSSVQTKIWCSIASFTASPLKCTSASQVLVIVCAMYGLDPNVN